MKPGQPDASELIKRIVTEDEDDHMPPKKSGKRLEEIIPADENKSFDMKAVIDHVLDEGTFLTDGGIAECRSLKTGELVYQERLKGPGPTAQNWSSLVRSGDKLYAVNQGGDAFVFRAAPKFEAPAGKYDWLNRYVFVGVAEKTPAGNQIHYYKVL